MRAAAKPELMILHTTAQTVLTLFIAADQWVDLVHDLINENLILIRVSGWDATVPADNEDVDDAIVCYISRSLDSLIVMYLSDH